MSRHQHHQLSAVAGPSVPLGSSSGSGPSDARETTFSYDQLVPDHDLPRGQIQGRLKMLFKQKPDQLDFAVKAKLTASSSYVLSKKQQKTVMVRFVLVPSLSQSPSSSGPALDSDYAVLRQSLGSTMAVDCTGARVVSRRTMSDGMTEVSLRATGSRFVTVDGTAHEFLKCEQSTPASRPRAVADWFSPSPAPPIRPAVTHESTRVDVTRASGVVPPPSILRPLSEVPQFVLQQHTSRERRAPVVAPDTAPAAQNPDVVRYPAELVRRDYVDLSSLGNVAVAPLGAVSTPPARALLPSPSTVISSRAETIDTPPSSLELPNRGAESEALKAELKLDSIDGAGTQGPGMRSETEESYFPDKQLSAIEEEAKRRSLAAEEARRGEPGSMQTAKPHRPATEHAGEAEWPLRDPSASTIQKAHEARVREECVNRHDQQQQQGDASKRPREAEFGESRGHKRARIDPLGDESVRQSPPRPPPPCREATETRASAEEAAIRRRQAQVRAAQAEKDRRSADSEQLRSSFQVHGRSIPRTYITLREAASRGWANVTAVIVDVKGGIRTTSTGDRSLTIVIADPSSHTNGNASEDMVVTLIRKSEAPLAPLEIGMPILFRSLKITTYNAKAKGQAFSNGQCTFHVLKNGEVVNCDNSGEGLSPREVERLTLLQQWWQDNGEPVAPGGHTSAAGGSDYANRGRTDRELGTVQEHQYFQLTGKILDMQLNTRGGNFPKYELYISDGTISADDVRDFHGVGTRYPWLPRGGLFTLAVQNDPIGTPFEPGQIVRFPNVRVKRYSGQLELMWSDKVTLQQEREGWKSRRHTLLSASDERAQAIEKRLKEWRRGRVPEGQVDPHAHVPEGAKPEPFEPEPAAPAPVPIAQHIATIYQDPLAHQRSTIPEIRGNATVPNRYRILVRVKEVLGRGAKGSVRGDFAVVWCGKCARAFAETHCRSCEDSAYKHAGVQWQMVLLLEDETGDELVAVLSGKQAETLLPPLPVVSTASTPADIARIRTQSIPKLRERVEDVLQGALFDGQRTRPRIDMTLESYTQDVQGQPVVVWRVFGMARSPITM